MLIDSHCHLDFPDFADELDAVVTRARAAGVGRMVSISTRLARHADLLAITERFPDVYCSVGTHPHYASEEPDVTAGDLVATAQHAKVVAIGEAGLDYHYDRSPGPAQAMPTPTPRASSRRKRGRAPSPLCSIVLPGAPNSHAAPLRSGCLSLLRAY
jgi:TatD DNase family protein